MEKHFMKSQKSGALATSEGVEFVRSYRLYDPSSLIGMPVTARYSSLLLLPEGWCERSPWQLQRKYARHCRNVEGK